MAGGMISRPDRHGHSVVTRWTDDADRVGIAEARRVFYEAWAKGGAVADLTHGGDGAFVKVFDPTTQSDLMIVPQMEGG